ncbi:hypothetical protein MCHI_001536 [Candidatus Magnetoovum chiemensis]|nr:hypothetical protein MCHI_001536 [Candidatus Magnetoovum chiemensis]
MPKGIDIIKMYFIADDMPNLGKLIKAYKYEIALDKEYVAKDALLDKINRQDNKWLTTMLIDFDIIDNRLMIFAQDTQTDNVRLSKIVQTLLDKELNAVDISRTGMYYGSSSGWREIEELGASFK